MNTSINDPYLALEMLDKHLMNLYLVVGKDPNEIAKHLIEWDKKWDNFNAAAQKIVCQRLVGIAVRNIPEMEKLISQGK